MGTHILSTVTAGLIQSAAEHKDTPSAIVTVGNEATIPFGVVDVSRGDQPSRLQIDLSLSGAQYISGVLKGLGTYQMQFMDCPLVVDSTDPGMFYTYLKSVLIKDRAITVRLFNKNVAPCKGGSRKLIAVFYGTMINAIITITPPEDKSATAYVKTQIDARGEWFPE